VLSEHRKTKPRDPSHYRRYGPADRQLRARWAPRVAAGVVECARCGDLIEPGEPFDLGHVDGTLAYSRPEHGRCKSSADSVQREGLPEWPSSIAWSPDEGAVCWLASVRTEAVRP
jgi:hypothetical protein